MSQEFKVLYDFTAEEEGEMSVKTGEVVVAAQVRRRSIHSPTDLTRTDVKIIRSP